MPHPRRTKIDEVLARLRDEALVPSVPGSRVVEMPLRALVTEKSPPPAIAVIRRPESRTQTTHDGGDERSLELLVSIAARSADECDEISNDVEDALYGVAGLRLTRTDFTYTDGSDAAASEVPFYGWVLTYALEYVTTMQEPTP